jgi:DNA-binding protein Alba
MKDGNVIYIGRKPVINYVSASPFYLNKSGYNDIIPKARGMAMSNALGASTRPTFQD